MDVLILVNHLNESGSGLIRAVASTIREYIDVNEDGMASALDVLLVVNFLNQLNRVAEGEVPMASDVGVSSQTDEAFSSDLLESYVPFEDELLEQLAARN